MDHPQQPRGTKRSFDTMIGIMDLWYKQEADAYAKKLLHVEAENKRLMKRMRVKDLVNVQLVSRVRELEQESTYRQLLLHEIFDRWPEVHQAYVAPLEAFDDLPTTESESEWEQDDLTFEPGEMA